jgi:hypothetical protein
LRAGIDPGFDQLAEAFLRARRGIAAGSGIPAPGDQIVFRHMLVQQREIASAIAVAVDQLVANISDGFSFPGHLDRREFPTRMSRNALKADAGSGAVLEILIGMTGRTLIACHAVPAIAARRRRLMQVVVIALQRPVACRVAVHAARMGDNLGGFREQRARARCRIRNAAEGGGRPQFLPERKQ